jgi:hypothetical protein
MESLSAEEQAEIKKMATDRLRVRLIKAGMDEEFVFTLDRPALMEAVAKVKHAGVVGEMSKPLEIWQRELSLREQELEFRRSESEAQRVEAESRWRAEMVLKERELEIHSRMEAAKLAEEKSLLGRTQKFAAAIKNIFPAMPRDSAELPSYFDSIENLFKLYDVPTDIQSKLLIAHLSGKPRSIVSKLSVAQLNDYGFVKNCLLNEFQITPRELRSRFLKAVKNHDESYAAFRGRLELLLMHYLKARKANADLVKLIDLFVADKLKDCLSPGALQYVLSLEGDSCFTSNNVASNADIYCSNYNEAGAYRGCNLLSVPLVDKFDNRKKFLYGRQNDAKLVGGPNYSSDKNGNGSKSNGVVLSSGSVSNTDLQSAPDSKKRQQAD